MADIFAYGSLMYEAVWSRVVTGHYEKLPASLPGYRRMALRGVTYPALIEGDGAVEGHLYRGVSPGDVRRLDLFEGDYYYRRRVEAATGGGTIAAETYVLREERRCELAGCEWSVAEFESRGIELFSEGYGGFEWMEGDD